MFDPKILREQPELVRKACELKHVDIDVDAAHILAVKRPKMIQQLEILRQKRNQASDEIAKKKKVREIHASLSFTDSHAIAVVLLTS